MLREFKNTKQMEAAFLIIHFIMYFMIDTFVIFATYWVAAVYPQKFSKGNTYLYGVKVGSALLVLFMFISNRKLPYVERWGVEKTLTTLTILSVFYLAIAILCFTIFNELAFFIFFISGSIILSLYRNNIYLHLVKVEKFRKCL